jgi:hypothetical protein
MAYCSGAESEPQSTPSAGRFKTFFITSVHLSLVTRSVSTVGWRSISSDYLIKPVMPGDPERRIREDLRESRGGHQDGEGSPLP